MFTKVWGRRRLAAVVGACTAGALVAAGTVSGASAGASVAQARATVSSATVPWSTVGVGWELVEYTNGTPSHHAATTLYLVSPAGAKYQMYTWSASANFAPGLVAWSGDKTRALLQGNTSGVMFQLNLQTRKLTKFTMAAGAQAIGYTRPKGLQILAFTSNTSGTVTRLARYTQAGAHVQDIATLNDGEITGVYTADGTALAVSGYRGIRLFKNTGVLLRGLAVPGTNPRMGCYPIRWWDSGTILAGCFADPHDISRLWLVPADGKSPKALTPQRTDPVTDAGDLDAWRLNSGLYVQSAGACGTLVLSKQNPNGSLTKVNVPHTPNANTRVVTSSGNRLLIDALTGCPGSNSLLWFNPGTHAEQWLFKAPVNAFGVLGVVPFYSITNAQSF